MHGHHHYHRCHERPSRESYRGPAIFYGYDRQSGRMQMMDYSEYINSIRDAYSTMYSNMVGAMQSYVDAAQAMMPGARREGKDYGDRGHGDCGCHQYGHHEHEHRCGCHGHKHDCHCTCCVRDADAVEYARCGESRVIPITLENDTRRERDVTLELGKFATGSGLDVNWEAGLSETAFKLPPCGEKTVLLRVRVDCGRFGQQQPGEAQREPSVDECKVVYATIRAEGCLIRPMVVAVAVLPNDCESHRSECGCGCC